MTTTVMPPSQEVLTDCVRLATLAPSLHNSQPWLFRIGPSGIELYADRNRRLPVLDPSGREQLISVGAALFTLRLAIGSLRTEARHVERAWELLRAAAEEVETR